MASLNITQAARAIEARERDVMDLADRRDVAMHRALRDLTKQVREHHALYIRDCLDAMPTHGPGLG